MPIMNHGTRPLELHAGQVVGALTLVIDDTTPEDLAMKVCAAWEVGRDYPEPSPLKMMERPFVEHLREELTPEQFTRLSNLIE